MTDRPITPPHDQVYLWWEEACKRPPSSFYEKLDYVAAKAAQKAATDNMNWLPINTAPKEFKPFNMFVVIALKVPLPPNKAPYTSDPWCVWRDGDGSFARWPHSFAPTHWCPLPDYDPRRPKPKPDFKGLVDRALAQTNAILNDLNCILPADVLETLELNRRELERLKKLEEQGDG